MIENILESYADGNLISMISNSNKISEDEILKILAEHKVASKYKKTFTDDFKKMIAMRDINGVSRTAISNELQINISTVRKACEQFGQACKEKAVSENLVTKIEGDFTMDECPNCKSKRNNIVDENVTFCMDCDMEHEYYDGYVNRVNFEYLEE